jgi:hypothetical protein
MFGFRNEEKPTFESRFERIHPADRESTLEAIKAATSTNPISSR